MLTSDTGRAAQMAKNDKIAAKTHVAELYYWVYSRPPVEEELKVAIAHIEKSKEKKHHGRSKSWTRVQCSCPLPIEVLPIIRHLRPK